MSLIAIPYIRGDIKKSGEPRKMFDIPFDGFESRKSGPSVGPPSRTGSLAGAASHSGQISNATARASYSTSGPVHYAGFSTMTPVKHSNSGPLNKHGEPIKESSGPQPGRVTQVTHQNSGALTPVLPVTRLITSGLISSGLIDSSGAPRKNSGVLNSMGSVKVHGSSVIHNQAVTTLSQDDDYSFRRNLSKPILWAMILGAVHNAILLIVVVDLFDIVAALFTQNIYGEKKAIIGFIANYPNAKLRTTKNEQYVRISGFGSLAQTNWIFLFKVS
ncbi:hypothetical protein U1Q18_021930 [Sarracenia purpurea var. burkii]